ncbi:hypothetical protein Gogos_015814, partial [Gossypium gossypioides]|nr:hypothetical protein [Gossypium gossypioides]
GTDLTLSSGELKNLRSLDEAFDGNQLDPKAKPLIQRVPSILGRHEDFRKYFKPRAISIGPLHHDDPTLHGSEKKLEQKWRKVHEGDQKVHRRHCYHPSR